MRKTGGFPHIVAKALEARRQIGEKLLRLTGLDLRVCPACAKGRMGVMAEIDPTGLDPLASGIDSS
jgi:hypothetical protein